MKERRCNLYDDNGKPRRLKDGTRGCPRDASACFFAHPHERSWEAARSSFPPNRDAVADSDSEFFYSLQPSRHDRDKEKDWDMHADRERRRQREMRFGSPPRRKDSTTTRGSPGGGSTTHHPGSPSLSVSSDKRELARKDSYRTAGKDLPSLRQDRSSHSRSRDKGKERADLTSKSPLAENQPSATSTGSLTFAPCPPATSPPMLPPPPPRLPDVPNLPAFASTEKHSKELSVDEQKSAWHERVDLMFTSITAHRDYNKLESDLARIRVLASSTPASNLPEPDRANLNAQKIALELQMEVKRKEVNGIIDKLATSGFWPVIRTSQLSQMEKALAEVKKHVLEMKDVMDEVRGSCAAVLKTATSDPDRDSERPSKRRKLEGEVEESTSTGPKGVSEDTEKGMEAFRDKLTELDRHLVDLENDIAQRDELISDEIELHIDSRLEAEDALYPPVSEPVGPSRAEIEAVVDAKNKELVHAVGVTGEEIGELAVEVAELITKVGALETRCKVLEAENQEFKCKLAQDTLNYTKSQDDLVRRDKEIEAIAAALQAYISQAPPGQSAGDLPSAEYIIESLDSQLDSLFREKFSPTLTDIKQEVIDKVQESYNCTLNTVSPKIVLLLKMVNLITARLGKADVEAVDTG